MRPHSSGEAPESKGLELFFFLFFFFFAVFSCFLNLCPGEGVKMRGSLFLETVFSTHFFFFVLFFGFG